MSSHSGKCPKLGQKTDYGRYINYWKIKTKIRNITSKT